MVALRKSEKRDGAQGIQVSLNCYRLELFVIILGKGGMLICKKIKKNNWMEYLIDKRLLFPGLNTSYFFIREIHMSKAC